uniref:Uncharacterized protein n=1 Tax=Heterorhabditis bacteriophora TaxID=37862 RepID=A0A1I7WEH4_HETBA
MKQRKTTNRSTRSHNKSNK